jgi:hypothetical protein
VSQGRSVDYGCLRDACLVVEEPRRQMSTMAAAVL